jgi:hypothetical protein
MSEMSRDEHDEAWSAIARSPLFSAYIYELHWLACDVVRRAEALFEQTPSPEPGSGYIKVDPSLSSEIYALLSDAAKMRLLITKRQKRRDQSRDEYEVLIRRVDTLAGLLSGLSLDAICSAEARHSVEHFDERLDKTALDIYRDTINKPVNLPFDLIVWSRAALELLKGTREPRPEIYPFRVYVASERRFLNAGAEIDIAALHDECAAVRDRLAPAVYNPSERGAFVSVLTETSFDAA